MSRFFIGVLVAVSLLLVGCGGSEDSGSGELAHQRELAEARRQGARDARQSAHIAELERRLERAGAEPASEGSVSAPPPSATPESGEPPLLEGYWQGDAEISYEDGKSDPFTQTIRIESLTVGAVAGYSEAHQGQTTCHGPLTYQGFANGWHRFTSVEENTAECIDSSEVELAPDEYGHLRYRETTDVSTSSGILERFR